MFATLLGSKKGDNFTIVFIDNEDHVFIAPVTVETVVDPPRVSSSEKQTRILACKPIYKKYDEILLDPEKEPKVILTQEGTIDEHDGLFCFVYPYYPSLLFDINQYQTRYDELQEKINEKEAERDAEFNKEKQEYLKELESIQDIKSKQEYQFFVSDRLDAAYDVHASLCDYACEEFYKERKELITALKEKLNQL